MYVYFYVPCVFFSPKLGISIKRLVGTKSESIDNILDKTRETLNLVGTHNLVFIFSKTIQVFASGA